MRIPVVSSLVAFTFATAAQADMDYSAMLRDQGLVGAQTTLSQIAEPTASDNFALGGVHFLLAVEKAAQQLYASDIDHEMAERSGLPFLRLPIPSNPNPEPFDPQVIAEVFETALIELAASIDALDRITDADEVAVVINTGDIWFDVDANGRRDYGEGFLELAAPQVDSRLNDQFIAPTVRFDTADAAWLSAYAHLLSGSSEVILATDPVSAVTRVVESRKTFEPLWAENEPPSRYYRESNWADLAAMFIHAIEGQPDIDRSRAAHAHFLSMIDDNRVFWERVALETDNDREWIPNPFQQSALQIRFPAETGPTWRAVLDDAEALLKGDLLIPHWRVGQNAGVNLAAAMQNPPEIDIIAIIQGEGVAPYLERGERINPRSLRQFERLMGGNAGLFMVILN